jgi:hypothetical protein
MPVAMVAWVDREDTRLPAARGGTAVERVAQMGTAGPVEGEAAFPCH